MRDHPAMWTTARLRRLFLVVLTVLVLWAVGYLAHAISDSVPPTGPYELRAREDAGDEVTR